MNTKLSNLTHKIVLFHSLIDISSQLAPQIAFLLSSQDSGHLWFNSLEGLPGVDRGLKVQNEKVSLIAEVNYSCFVPVENC